MKKLILTIIAVVLLLPAFTHINTAKACSISPEPLFWFTVANIEITNNPLENILTSEKAGNTYKLYNVSALPIYILSDREVADGLENADEEFATEPRYKLVDNDVYFYTTTLGWELLENTNSVSLSKFIPQLDFETDPGLITDTPRPTDIALPEEKSHKVSLYYQDETYELTVQVSFGLNERYVPPKDRTNPCLTWNLTNWAFVLSPFLLPIISGSIFIYLKKKDKKISLLAKIMLLLVFIVPLLLGLLVYLYTNAII